MNEVIKVLRIGDRLSAAVGAYALALARRQDGLSSDDEEISNAIADCVEAKKAWDTAIIPAEFWPMRER